MEEFRYLATTLTNKNSIQDEIKTRFNSANACYYSVQNIFLSCLLFENLSINLYRTIIFPLILCGCKTWSLTLREELG
jgi:hypothetical protein